MPKSECNAKQPLTRLPLRSQSPQPKCRHAPQKSDTTLMLKWLRMSIRRMVVGLCMFRGHIFGHPGVCNFRQFRMYVYRLCWLLYTISYGQTFFLRPLSILSLILARIPFSRKVYTMSIFRRNTLLTLVFVSFDLVWIWHSILSIQYPVLRMYFAVVQV
jgi:hypothetical protein